MFSYGVRVPDRSHHLGLRRPRSLRIEPLEDRWLLAARAVEVVNLFALDVYEHLQREQGNLFFSPLSISAGLAMTYAGAAGQTAAEMEDVLHLGTEPGIHASFNALLSALEMQSSTVSDFEISVTNAIWPRLDLPINPTFVDTIETDYRGHVQGVDFANPQQAEDVINAWVAAATEGRIQDLVSGLGADTAMVLTNSIYFRALWDYPFDPLKTDSISETFFRSAHDVVAAPMMYTQPYAARTQISGFDVLDVSLANGAASMIFILPTEQNGPNYLTSETLRDIEEWVRDPHPTEHLELVLPRFQTTVDTGLNQLLIGLGMPAAFDAATADFSAMTEEPVFIKEVFHKAFIEVTEQGTEAAAATEVELALCFAAGTPVLTPNGERPIELLEVGDYVLARDEHSVEGDVLAKRVEETRHGHADILEVHVAGRIIRTTTAHPFFVQKRGWIPAGKLKAKDRLSTNLGDWIEVDKIVETGSAEAVFNLRVADFHTYFIGSKAWEFAVWTHNFYDTGFYADHPFHFVIRDNTTSAITFMGRIDDPSQMENRLEPTVEPKSADIGDYDNDGDVDDVDYNVWKAAFGQKGASLPADGNGNGVVDIADYVLWRNQLAASVAHSVSVRESHSGPRAELAKENQAASTFEMASPKLTETAQDLAITPIGEPEIHLPSPFSPLRQSLFNDLRRLRTPQLVEVPDDDLLLLAAGTPPPTASESPIPYSQVADSRLPVDDVFAELEVATHLDERILL